MTQTPHEVRTVTIDRLGAQGDGVSETEGGPVFIPYALPGETVRAEITGDRGRIVERLDASPHRRDPICGHYTRCGGCVLQHLAPPAYRAFKTQGVAGALAARGLSADLTEAPPQPDASRRRAVFAGARGPGGVVVGFHRLKAHQIEPIDRCPILTPALQSLAPRLRPLVEAAAPRRGGLQLTAVETGTGVDLDIAGAGPLDADRRARLAGIALAIGLARLSLDGETAVERTRPLIAMGAAQVAPPPGGFLQASAAAEEAMGAAALDWLGAARSALDLFAGAGAFALRLARLMRVHAVDAEAPALEALRLAAHRTGGLKPVTVERRDLFRRPLHAAEIERFGAVVLDPPRAGAEAQCAHLARARIDRIVYASCNPATLVRDLAVLVGGGWRLAGVRVIDQFLYSAHVEAVALLER